MFGVLFTIGMYFGILYTIPHEALGLVSHTLYPRGIVFGVLYTIGMDFGILYTIPHEALGLVSHTPYTTRHCVWCPVHHR